MMCLHRADFPFFFNTLSDGSVATRFFIILDVSFFLSVSRERSWLGIITPIFVILLG